MLNISEEFWAHALPRLGGGEWSPSLPLVPLAANEINDLFTAQQQHDEHVALRQLGDLGSVSATIVLRLNTGHPLEAATIVLRISKPRGCNRGPLKTQDTP